MYGSSCDCVAIILTENQRLRNGDKDLGSQRGAAEPNSSLRLRAANGGGLTANA